MVNDSTTTWHPYKGVSAVQCHLTSHFLIHGESSLFRSPMISTKPADFLLALALKVT